MKKIAICILTCCIIFIVFTSIKLNSYENKVYPKSKLYGTDISNMDKVELENVVNNMETSILKMEVVIKSKSKEYKLNLEDIIKNINKEQLTINIMDYGKDKNIVGKAKEIILPEEKNYEFNIDFNESSLEYQINAIAIESNIKYKNAKAIIENDKISIENGSNGFELDKEDLNKSIIEGINHTGINKKIVVEAKYKEVNPKIDEKYLEYIDTKISQHYTGYSGSAGRMLNVENAAKKIDDLILMPGEEFSYEEAVGPVTYENGYKDAPVIVNGESSMGVGGGVCQVSSTMYNTQLKAGILSTERRNHSKAVSYVPRGLDATLASGSIDYKFKNTYEYPLIINAYTENRKIYIEFWSNEDATKGINYEPISFINGKTADSYLYGYDSAGKKVYEKYIDKSVYK